MRELTGWLVNLGHRRIAALTDPSARNPAVPDQLSLAGYDGLQFLSTSPHVFASFSATKK